MLQQRIPGSRLLSQRLPDCEGIELMLVDPRTVPLRYTQQEIHRIMAEPAYWSLCWGSGLALAQYLMARPEQLSGQTVVDFGAGSGIVAIAAARAGAKKVIACDIDEQALAAVAINAEINGVEIERLDDLSKQQDRVDLLIAADVLYDRENLGLLDGFLACAKRVLVADSRIRDFNVPPYRRISQVECTTFPDIDEFREFGRVSLYEALAP
ncbi:50S ribosomal protein L11 methyltransferase [Aestuariirhabdus sp. Z084]|nr:50S ribosomal protein L11 methyltransferase [Aestuariirhabdus haliotis]MCL6415561.1 50S ribosomal protein L11 methyltransferase [Aestuariirhabdus haliotis]MCL6419234.1 50S ribosomal protein L11 methyltransferase [Aestuariirhabdus haliotis]